MLLQPDVREYFPDSDSVNTALRSLVALMSKIPRKAVEKKKTRKAKADDSAQTRRKQPRA